MAQGPYVMGIDGGTESVRVGIFDIEGAPVVFSSQGYELYHPRPGWAEQDPDEWWSALVAATRQAMSSSGLAAEDIAGISIDTTASTVLAMDENDRHMGPAILWMDARAADQRRRFAETEDPALKYNVSAEWLPPKALWIKENQPDVYAGARHICEYQDWMTHKLTGEWTASINQASAKWFHDRDSGGFPTSLFDAVGLEDLLDKLPPRLLELGEPAGTLQQGAADELGLRAGTPVAEGGIDAFVATVGLGVVDPGKVALITGSSHVLLGQVPQPLHGPGFFGAFTDCVVPGLYTVEGGQISTGSIVAWFKNRLAKGATAEAERRGVDPYDVLNEWAAELPPGSEGLIVMDYFQGNRTPYSDPLARGAVWGLSLGHGEAHLFRAILEGVCYGTEHAFRVMRDQGFQPSEIVAAGGATKSDLWMQIHADVSNVPISLTKVSEAPVLGSAILASVGAGIYPTVGEAVGNMVHVERQIEPDAERSEQYQFYVDKYVETYPQLRELLHDMTRHETERHG